MKKRKIILPCICAALVCLAFFGCGSSADSSNNNSQDATNQVEAEKAESGDTASEEYLLSVSEPVEIEHYDSFVYAKWMVTNESDKPISDFSIKFVDYDSGNNIINAASYSVEPGIEVAPGQAIAVESNHEVDAVAISAVGYNIYSDDGNDQSGELKDPVRYELQ